MGMRPLVIAGISAWWFHDKFRGLITDMHILDICEETWRDLRGVHDRTSQ